MDANFLKIAEYLTDCKDITIQSCVKFAEDNKIDLNDFMKFAEAFNTIDKWAKANSKRQQRFMAMVYAAKKGKPPASKAVAEAAEGISKQDAKDFAQTKTDKLPEKKEEKKAEALKTDGDADAGVKELKQLEATEPALEPKKAKDTKVDTKGADITTTGNPVDGKPVKIQKDESLNETFGGDPGTHTNPYDPNPSLDRVNFLFDILKRTLTDFVNVREKKNV